MNHRRCTGSLVRWFSITMVSYLSSESSTAFLLQSSPSAFGSSTLPSLKRTRTSFHNWAISSSSSRYRGDNSDFPDDTPDSSSDENRLLGGDSSSRTFPSQLFNEGSSTNGGNHKKNKKKNKNNDFGNMDNPTFAMGDDLHQLRRQVMDWRAELFDAPIENDLKSTLQRCILDAQQQDAEYMYSLWMERQEEAESQGRWTDAEQYGRYARHARQSLPQYQLDGLWVGKYGDHGYELINITYIGDVLHAYKVTGHANVPKGELSFSVDLKPSSQVALEPVVLGDNAARQWGAKYLSRYVGKGQVAGEGHVNAQFVEGQLILVNDFFSFAWVPIGHQVFFGRPTPELVLKLMRESQEGKSDVDRARAHINRCMEETINYLELEMDDLPSLAVPQEDFYSMDGYFE